MQPAIMPSRIPVRVHRPPASAHSRTVSAPSKLERLAAEYQQRLLREKEQKLMEMYQQDTQRALRGTGGQHNRQHKWNTDSPPINMNVRDFFRERRDLENGAIDNAHFRNNIKYHYEHKKKEASVAGVHRRTNSYHGTYAARPPVNPVYQKRSAGRDKASPLAPLNTETQSKANGHTHHRKHSGSRRLSSGSPAANGLANGTHHSPKPPPFDKKPHLVRAPRQPSGNSGYGSASEVSREPSPQMDIKDFPSNKALIPISSKPRTVHKATSENHNGRPTSDYQKWQQNQAKRIQDPSQKNSPYNTTSDPVADTSQPRRRQKTRPVLAPIQTQEPQQEKLSDYQKWQLEQDKAREGRLKKCNAQRKQQQISSSPEDEECSARVSDRNMDRTAPTSDRSTARTETSLISHKPPIVQQKKKAILRNARPPSSDEEESEEEEGDEEIMEIKRKEAELTELIKRQEQELQKMRQQRLKEQDQEKKDRELKKQRLAKQRDRIRRMKDAEDTSQFSRASDSEDGYTSQQEQYSRSRSNSLQRDPPSGRLSRRRDTSSRNSEVSEPPTRPPAYKPKPSMVRRQRSSVPQESQPAPNNENTAFYHEMAETSGAVSDINLVQCPVCDRKFSEDRLAKHAKVCKSNSKKKKRKVYDPVKMRSEGTEYAKYAHTASKKAAPAPKSKKANWRAQHESFIKTIRYAKKVSEMESQGADLKDLPPPPPTDNPDYVQCPHCSRKFNPTTAERHIPKCKDIKARPAPPKSKKR